MTSDLLPIDPLLPSLLQALESHTTVLLQAQPGAGKTTRVPLALLEASWRHGGRILMLEPRRLAARSAARFMAGQLGEPVGKRVGYRTRLDTRVSEVTRIEVVTEGILTRMLQTDPALETVAAVIFDEFHERSLQADLGLALARESQQALREDLRLLIMSATLDTEPLATLLDNAPVLTSEGRQYPVEVFHRPLPRSGTLVAAVCAAITHALDQHDGSILVFLPGVGEIRRVEEGLAAKLPEDTQLTPLYGNLDTGAQDRAITPAPSGKRKVVLATAIAETSLTIEGVQIVIDAGLQRRAQFDPNSGMTRLVTGRVSKSSADQRKGRAGRTGPGVCYRLWSETEDQALAPYTPAEILSADLAPLVLELAQWGARSPRELCWLDPPPQAHWDQAAGLLRWLDAITAQGEITAHGKAMTQLGLHPRLAHMVLRGREQGLGDLAAELAALLSERDILRQADSTNLEWRVQALRGDYQHPGLDRKRLQPLRRTAQSLQKGVSPPQGTDTPPYHSGALLALAFPDRVARRRAGKEPRYLLSNGRGARLTESDPLATSEWLVAADLDGESREARLFLTAPLSRSDMETQLAHHLTEADETLWDDKRGTVIARRVQRLGALVVCEKPLPAPDSALIEQALLREVQRRGLDSLPWSEPSRQWQGRVELLHRLWPEDWPATDTNNLLLRLDQWLAPFLAGLTHWKEVQSLDLMLALNSLLDYAQQQRLNTLAPTALELPSGHSARLDYCCENGPVLAAKLQALFGWQTTPRIANGRVAVVLHLLSPARRPLAITADLESFWRQAYPQVRKDMRGRYPKHPWPEDPLTAQPTMGVR